MADARHLCQEICRAGCCRGPLVLRLGAGEVPRFRALAAELGVAVRVREGGRDAEVRFLEHPGSRCPMLDGATSACRIYESRPFRCRAFPERPRPDCVLSTRDLR
ncbi:MAG TPA: YkgJ family cysteine cluster protein [Vicinamibacteria bacterium]|nr:YkgJ family cysteine cluster protein [Vicinamibacteria bacterium]